MSLSPALEMSHIVHLGLTTHRHKARSYRICNSFQNMLYIVIAEEEGVRKFLLNFASFSFYFLFLISSVCVRMHDCLVRARLHHVSEATTSWLLGFLNKFYMSRAYLSFFHFSWLSQKLCSVTSLPVLPACCCTYF